MGEELDTIAPKCGAVRDRLSEWVDGELDPAAAERVHAHLLACGPCRRFACEFEATVIALHALGVPCCR